jgi:hypothetical protein
VTEGSILWRFYAPILVGIAVLSFTRSVRATKDPLKVSIQFLLFAVDLPTPRWLKGARGARFAVAVLGVSLIGFGASADFSRFFPNKLRMDIYFDQNGIERELTRFTPDERLLLGLAPEPWDAYQGAYVSDMKQHLAMEIGSSTASPILDTLGITRANTHGRGQTSFVVEREGLFRYRIVASEGEMLVVADVPNRMLRPAKTIFTLTDSPMNHLRPTPLQLLGIRDLVLMPRFKQIIRLSNAATDIAPFDHMVLGVTKVSVLPAPQFGSTVYLLELSDGQRVPIGYAIYY